MKKWISVTALSMIVAVAPMAVADAKVDVATAYDKSAKYMTKPQLKLGDEWAVIGLARGDYAVPSNYFVNYYNNVVSEIKANNGIVHPRRAIDNAKLAITVTAIGQDAKNVCGYDLFTPLAHYDKVIENGIMGPVWTLIALNSRSYVLPTGTNTEDKMISYIVDRQKADGGFALSGNEADADVTALVLQSLAPYAQTDANIAQIIDDATSALANMQRADGGYESLNVPTAESSAQVIVALTENGIVPEKDTRFAKALPYLLTYQQVSGGFKHIASSDKVNYMASEQGNYALAAMKRQEEGKTSLYNMEDSRYQSIDLYGHWAHPFAMETKRKGIMSGDSLGKFNPQASLTRAQSAAIIVRMLKLNTATTVPFNDISHLPAQTQREISAAYEAGIVKGSGGKFNPQGKVTRTQLALMLLRAYNDQTTPYEPTKIAPFTDISKLDNESQKAITLLYEFSIASGSEGKFNPSNSTSRAQAAKMINNFDELLQ